MNVAEIIETARTNATDFLHTLSRSSCHKALRDEWHIFLFLVSRGAIGRGSSYPQIQSWKKQANEHAMAAWLPKVCRDRPALYKFLLNLDSDLRLFQVRRPAKCEQFDDREFLEIITIPRIFSVSYETVYESLFDLWTKHSFLIGEIEAIGLPKMLDQFEILRTIASPYNPLSPSLFWQWYLFLNENAEALALRPELLFQGTYNQSENFVIGQIARRIWEQHRATGANSWLATAILTRINRDEMCTLPHCEFINASGCISSLAYDPAHDTIAVVDSDSNDCSIWRVSNAERLRTLEDEDTSAVISLDGQQVVTQVGRMEIPVHESDSPSNRVTNLYPFSALSHDGRRIASWLKGSIIVHPVDSFEPMLTLQGHTDNVDGIAFDRENALLASVTDHEIKVWDIASGLCQLTCESKTGDSWIRSLAIDSRCGLLAAAGRQLEVWDLSTGLILKDFRLPNAALSMVIDPVRRRVLTGHSDGVIRIWDVDSPSHPSDAQSRSQIIGCEFDPAGTHVITFDNENIVRVWDVLTGKCTKTVACQSTVIGVALRLAEGIVASNTVDNLQVWGVAATDSPIVQFGKADQFSLNSPGTMIAFIQDDRLTLVDLESKNKYWNEEYFFHDVWQIEFESETNEIVVFLEDGSSPRFRIAGGSLVLSPAHDTREIPVQIERARVVKEPYSRRFPVEFEIEGASCCLLERYDSVFLSPEGRLVAAFRQAQAPHFYRLSSRSPVP